MESIQLKNRNDVVLHLLISFIFTNFLFFIDEGYYDFRWMHDPGNWIVFGIYAGFMWLFSWLFAHFVLRKYTLGLRITLSALLGISAALILLIGVFFQGIS